jgi:hypothetical protein
MKTTILTWMALCAALLNATAAPLRTGFDYQGRLGDGAQSANGSFDFRFALFNAAAGGTQAGQPVTNMNVLVTNGLFNTAIDFGASVFDGTQFWLEIGVRPSGSSTVTFTTLAPRQAIAPTPYALHALSSAGVAAGVIDNLALAPNAVSADKIAAGQAVKSFNGLADDIQFGVEGDLALRVEGNRVVLAPLVSCFTYTNCYWNLRGNGNITEGTHFLGTVANELAPLEFRVNNNRSLLHVFTTPTTAPNLIGGFANNVVTGSGSVIAGGGKLGGFNDILGNDGTISGGFSNRIGGLFPTRTSVIGGGNNHHIDFDGIANTIGGGETNTIEAYVRFGTIGGGSRNFLRTAALAGTIAGGEQNTNGVAHGSIGGGWRNTVAGTAGTLAGGERNWIQNGAGHSMIGGGVTNRIESDAAFATVSGGATNRIGTNSSFAVISGGGNNVVGTNSPETTISGGQRNAIEANTAVATIGGGGTNRVLTTAVGATISGGAENVVTTPAPFATIPGGSRAMARSYGQLAYASGSFSSIGDAQAGIYVVRNTTSTNTASGGIITDLFLDGASRRIRVPADSAWTFEISIAARDGGTSSAAYLVRGTIENNAGVTAFPVPPVIDILNEDVAAWGVQLIADDANDALVVRVTGSIAAPVRWVATVRTTEVVFP